MWGIWSERDGTLNHSDPNVSKRPVRIDVHIHNGRKSCSLTSCTKPFTVASGSQRIAGKRKNALKNHRAHMHSSPPLRIVRFLHSQSGEVVPLSNPVKDEIDFWPFIFVAARCMSHGVRFWEKMKVSARAISECEDTDGPISNFQADSQNSKSEEFYNLRKILTTFGKPDREW